MVAGDQQLWAAELREKLQTAPEQPQGVADIAGQDKAVGGQFCGPTRKCHVVGAARGLIVEVGGNYYAHNCLSDPHSKSSMR